MKIMTVLKCGGEYNEGHVQWLKKQIPDHRVYCITDSIMPPDHFYGVTGCIKIDLLHGAWGSDRGWWAKMEMFRPDIKGDFLYADLDTVFLQSPRIFQEMTEPCVLADFYFPGTSIGSGLMFLPEHCRRAVWDRWNLDIQGHILHCHGDQDFLTPILWNADRFQSKFPFSVVSYKAHIDGSYAPQFYKPGFDDLAKIDVCCFHGMPRPWHVQHKHEWIPK